MKVEIFETKALRNLETGEIILLPYWHVELQDNGLIIVREEKGLYGIIDQKGREIVPPKYDHIDYFNNGLAIVRDEKGLYGIIDQEGKEIVPPKYADIDDFNNGLAIIKSKNDLYGLINEKGKEVIEPMYNEVSFSYIGPEEAVVVINKIKNTYQIARGGKRIKFHNKNT